MARVGHTEVAKVLRQVAPKNACAQAIRDRIDEQPVIARGGSGLSGLPGSHVFDALPMRIWQCLSLGHASSHAACSFVFKSQGVLIDDTP